MIYVLLINLRKLEAYWALQPNHPWKKRAVTISCIIVYCQILVIKCGVWVRYMSSKAAEWLNYILFIYFIPFQL